MENIMSEKEYNGLLIDQMAMLERLEEIAEETGNEKMKDAIKKEKRIVDLKLYQRPNKD